MKDNFGILEVYGDLIMEIEELFKVLHIYTRYSMFTHSNKVEMAMADEESFLCAMMQFELLRVKHKEILSVAGIVEDLKILIMLGESGE